MLRRNLSLVAATCLLVVGVVLPLAGSPSDAIPPIFIDPGSYSSRNPDGSHPYGASHGIEIGIDVLDVVYVEECIVIQTTRSWSRPLGGGPKTYSETTGEIEWDWCEGGSVADLFSGSVAGLSGDLIANDDGSFTADYTAQGGNRRVWHPM